MQFLAIIHYVKPCGQGGITSAIWRCRFEALNEDEAEAEAERMEVNDPHYLYRNMVEVNRIYSCIEQEGFMQTINQKSNI